MLNAARPNGMTKSKSILTKDEAETRALEYKPRDFPFRPSAAAVEFVRIQTEQENPEFQVDHVVSVTSGIAELEKHSLSERVETEALEKLKTLQEEAYRQGYDLGRDEGQESAYREKNEELAEKLSKLDRIIHGLETLKADLVKQNEGSLVTLSFEMAKRMALAEISMNRETILRVLEQAAQSAQDEESMTIRMAESDFAFIEESKARLGKEFEFIRKARLESAAGMQPGGCVIMTNYGQVDATIEMRLGKLWSSISEILPKRSDVNGNVDEP